MIFGQEVVELLRAARYQAPASGGIIPNTISPNRERVEIITGGKVEYKGRIYGRGAIFRHLEGERTVHLFPPGNPYRCVTMLFKLSRKSTREYPRLTFWQGRGGLDEFARDCVRGFHSPDAPTRELGVYIYSTLNWHSARSAAISAKGGVPQAIRAAIDYLDAHTETAIPVEFLAKMTNLSKPYFQFLFKKHTGTTPHQYHLAKRIGLAREKLAFGGLNVRTVSEECGFDNPESFHRAFRKATGLTPGEYRSKHSAAYWTNNES